jgi:hypothetical protein
VSRGLVVRLAALAFSLFAALLAVEIGLRVLGVSWPRFYDNHADLGHVYRPGVSFWWRDEGNGFVEINRHGYRDRDWTIEKPAGTVRVAVLGDSYVDARQVHVDSTFVRVLERRLNECRAFGDRRVETMNFGVSGYGTAQEYLTLKGRVAPFDPDIVVLAFLTGNDFRNNTAALHREAGRPYFVERNGELVFDDAFRANLNLDDSWKRRLVRFAFDHSRVAQLVDRVRRISRRREALAERGVNAGRADAAGGEAGAAALLEAGLDDGAYREPTDEAWREAWRLTERLLLRTRDEAARQEAELLVAVLSNGLQVHPDPGVRDTVRVKLAADDLLYPDRRLAAFGDSTGLPVLLLAPPLGEWTESHKAFVHGFDPKSPGTGHWNETGHRLAGRLLAEAVAARFGTAPCAAGVID